MLPIALNLNSMVKPEQSVEFDYPGFTDFKVTLCYLGREKLNTIRKACVIKKITKQGVEDGLDLDKFNKLYSQAVIKGWSGFKLSYVSQLMLVTLPDEVNQDTPLEYTVENAEALLKHSTDFDTFVTSMLSDLANFTKHG
jgi:hypothetical protein